MIHLQEYGNDGEGDSDDSTVDFEDITSKTIVSLQNKMQVCAAPDVVPTVS
jgi:hypothetical protein